MRSARYLLPLLLALLFVLFSAFVVPIGLEGAMGRCGLSASAQDNPCLAQEATISAQEVRILQLELTGTAIRAELDAAQRQVVAQAATELPPAIPTTTTIPIMGAVSTATQPLPALSPSPMASPVEIVRAIGLGRPNEEAVIIRNIADTAVNLDGWRLANTRGDTFIFPARTLNSGARLTVYTGAGTNAPDALYWRLNRSVWARGDILTLADRRGRVFATYTIP